MVDEQGPEVALGARVQLKREELLVDLQLKVQREKIKCTMLTY